MRFGRGHGFVSSQYGGGTVFQFSAQMLPFVKQLSVGFFEDDYLRAAADFRAVEFVAAPGRFLVNGFKKGRNGCGRAWMPLKSVELGMMAVALGLAAKDFLRQQCLAPERDEAFGVEVFRMHGPESHG